MYHKTPDLQSYVAFIRKYRVAVLVTFFMIAVAILSVYRPKLLTSEAMFWLKESKQFEHNAQENFKNFFLVKLQVDVDTFDAKNKLALQKLQDTLSDIDGVQNVSSLFSKLIIKQELNNHSSMVGVIPLGEMDPFAIKQYVKKRNNPYENFVTKNFTHFTFYILTKKELDLTGLDTPLQYSVDAKNKAIAWKNYILYGVVIFLFVSLLFYALFANFFSSVGALLVVSLTSIFTFSLIGYIQNSSELYVAMPFISLSIATVDYLYFYFRWHVSQYKTDSSRALVKMLDRNVVPALWTTLLTILGLGSLLFLDLEVVRLLAMSVILSSLFVYIINMTFLPAFLSFFETKHPNVAYDRVCYYLAVVETRYSKKLLLFFLMITFFLSLIGIAKVYEEKNALFQMPSDVEEIVIEIPYKTIDLDFIHKLQHFRKNLLLSFEESIEEIDALDAIVMQLNAANAQTTLLDTQALAQALFYLDLYQLSERYFDPAGVKVVLHTDGIELKELIEWLQGYKELDIHILDKSLAIDKRLYDQKILLAISLVAVLVLIAGAIGFIFRSVLFAFGALVVNAAPIVWFGFLLNIFGFKLSFELLIAMTIALGLASDATIHLAFKYFRSRYFKRSVRRSLQKMFFYSGTPVIFGSLVLIVFFTFLFFFQVESLQHIGVFTALLILLYMVANLIVLPVMLQFIEKKR